MLLYSNPPTWVIFETSEPPIYYNQVRVIHAPSTPYKY